jgi:hypothetical protein
MAFEFGDNQITRFPFYSVCQALYGSGYETTVPYKGIKISTIVNRDDGGLA